MKRIGTALVLVSLALPASAAAKGPHAMVSPGPEGLRPGQPWVATLTLIELRKPPEVPPTVVLRRGATRVAVRAKPLDTYDPPNEEVFAEARYRVRAVFPHAGRWSYTVVDGKRRFRFPAATIGGRADRVSTGYVAFAEGSRAEREGGGGPIMQDVPENPPGDDGVLPPEVVLPPKDEDDDGPGLALWIPAAGLALVAAAATARRRFGRG